MERPARENEDTSSDLGLRATSGLAETTHSVGRQYERVGTQDGCKDWESCQGDSTIPCGCAFIVAHSFISHVSQDRMVAVSQ